MSRDKQKNSSEKEPISETETVLPEAWEEGSTSQSWWVPEDMSSEEEGLSIAVERTMETEERYQDLGLLGTGGMGEVRKVWDSELKRTLAMKIIHPELSTKQHVVSRFIEEVQICAQLQHPNIVPVHEIGRLNDGRLYFTMKEVKGKLFSDVIFEFHQAAEIETRDASSSKWSLRKLIDAFHKCCLAVSYAHSHGVLHRDLKPQNIMLGEYGEVLVLDWGIAKVLRAASTDNSEHVQSEETYPEKTEYKDDFINSLETGGILSNRSEESFFKTQAGQIAGTPAYMSLEQARGKTDELDIRTDIYSLGAILYEILAGFAPYQGRGRQVLEKVLAGPPASVRSSFNMLSMNSSELEFLEKDNIMQNTPPPFLKELVEACEKAMEREKERRFQNAFELGKVILDWLDGSKKREEALKVVEEALALDLTCEKKREEAKILARRAEEGLRDIEAWEGEDVKFKWWIMAEKAKKLTIEADILQIVQEQKLQAALTHKADLEEAHLELAKRYLQQHRQFEIHRDTENASKTEVKLREHASALPNLNPERERLFAYLKGTGAISIRTDVDDVDIFLEKYDPYQKRVIAKPIAHLGNKPLEKYPLGKGSYRLRLRKKGHAEVLYPISLTREQHWESIDPFGKNKPIRMPKLGEIGEHECFIPAGWFWAGGDPENQYALSQKQVWVDDFVVRTFPITNREYLQFLNDLMKQGREEEAFQHAPKERLAQVDDWGTMCYGRDTDGFFKLVPDADGDIWDLDWPIILVDWYSSMAYAKWEAKRKGRKYRLLHELEWEKAARGVDGRFFPWGDGFDPTYACMNRSHQGRPLIQKVDSFPIDTSVYGVRGMAGNSTDWCATLRRKWEDLEELKWLNFEQGVCLNFSEKLDIPNLLLQDFSESCTKRGGYWHSGKIGIRSATRSSIRPTHKSGGLGFRLGYSF